MPEETEPTPKFGDSDGIDASNIATAPVNRWARLLNAVGSSPFAVATIVGVTAVINLLESLGSLDAPTAGMLKSTLAPASGVIIVVVIGAARATADWFRGSIFEVIIYCVLEWFVCLANRNPKRNPDQFSIVTEAIVRKWRKGYLRRFD